MITNEGTFWIQRFRDAWESCAHKKAVAFAIFTLVWNLSSIVARIWAGKFTVDTKIQISRILILHRSRET